MTVKHPSTATAKTNRTARSDGRATGNGARRGAQLLQKLKDNPPEVWYAGEKVNDVTSHPAFRNGIHSLAALYDLQ
ncbi:MAG TPA: 4-hydroxyphenylacetate 3-hydroxylase N-terminal domain-containing protein, partial [Bacteroidota bacterium]